jgi:hypothetical protein
MFAGQKNELKKFAELKNQRDALEEKMKEVQETVKRWWLIPKDLTLHLLKKIILNST